MEKEKVIPWCLDYRMKRETISSHTKGHAVQLWIQPPDTLCLEAGNPPLPHLAPNLVGNTRILESLLHHGIPKSHCCPLKNKMKSLKLSL